MRFFYLKKYVGEILNMFQMKDCNSLCILVERVIKLHKNHDGEKVDNTYSKQIVGNLILYLIITRSDIIYFVSLINGYMKILMS